MMITLKLEVIIRMILFLWLQREDYCPPASSSLAHLQRESTDGVELLRELMKNYHLIDK
jgi:hypothetical protein